MAQANKFCCRRDVRIYYNIIHTGTIIYGIPSTKSPPVVYRKPNWPGPACSPLTRFYQTVWGGVGWWCGRAILWSPPPPRIAQDLCPAFSHTIITTVAISTNEYSTVPVQVWYKVTYLPTPFDFNHFVRDWEKALGFVPTHTRKHGCHMIN